MPATSRPQHNQKTDEDFWVFQQPPTITTTEEQPMSDALQRQQRMIDEYQHLQTGQHFAPQPINPSNSTQNPEFDAFGEP